MAILDCESYESSLKSICELYCANTADVIEFLLGIDLNKEYEKNVVFKTPEDHLIDLFESEFGSATEGLNRVSWFHLTRVPAGTDFCEGILPLHLAIDRIWRTIISIPSDPQKRANLEKLRYDGVRNDLYTLKTQDRLHSGPYAMLVRESAFHPNSMGNHDYLAFPEIIEDICNGYQEEFGERIHEEISCALRKCIVKFEVVEESGHEVIAPSLLYCWCKIQSEELSDAANTCYDARGVAVPYTTIRKVEFLP